MNSSTEGLNLLLKIFESRFEKGILFCSSSFTEFSISLRINNSKVSSFILWIALVVGNEFSIEGDFILDSSTGIFFQSFGGTEE